ncbi:MAG: hypothetical protein MK101_06515 [Phycisphaerales bacterium]|nr:hypothetical protein [Phycisphaerales bacterium]
MIALLLAASGPLTHNLTLPGPRDWTYDARLVEPLDEPSGLTVLMIGGGLGNDLEWTVPGSIQWNGEHLQMTIDGTTHADAPRIADSLARSGHAVMYYSTIAREDPKRDRWPVEMTMLSPADLLQMARNAAEAVRAHPATDDNALILLGHSMGAQRACAQAAEDPGVKGLVLLGGAQMTRTGPGDSGRNLHKEAAVDRLESLDIDGDGAVTGSEIPAGLDFDQDGQLRVWELSASLAAGARADITDRSNDNSGMPFGEDSLGHRAIPTLALYGSLDEAQAHHAPILAALKTDGTLEHVQVRMLPDIGHQLGPEQDGRLGPISDAAVDAIVAFVESLRSARPTEDPA